MGTRYIVTVVCPGCGVEHEDVWYAPTCGVKVFVCTACGERIDLEAYTGISEQEASNRTLIEQVVREMEKGGEG